MYYLTVETAHGVEHYTFNDRNACAAAIETLWARALDIWMSKDGQVFFSLLDYPWW